MSDELPEKEKDWVYRDSTKKLLMRLLLIACALSVLAEFLVKRKGKFKTEGGWEIDGTFAFYAILGFVSCTLMIFIAKGLGYLLKVRTDYYENPNKEDQS